MNTRLIGIVAAGALFASMAQADTQTWNDSGPSSNWSTNEANWAGGAVWTNGNSAVFTGGGGLGKAVDVAAIVNVANITFQTNGYVIADANNDGTLTVTGMPSVITVVNAGDTGTVRAAISGSGGFVKAGNGTLNLTGTNTYSGTTIVSNGTLRLAPGVLQGLGATGTGNETVVAAGATLDENSSFTGNLNEDITIQGTGVGGIGALVNTGPTDYYNVGYRNLTLAGDATIGVYRRFDMSGIGTYYGNGYTLTKIGGAEMAVSRAVNNSPIVINAGTYTIQSPDALGSTDYPTTLNGTGKLQAWGSYTIAERLIVNGGTISATGTGANTFRLTGNMTLNSNVTFQTDVSVSNALELAGVMDGAGGFTRGGSGFVYILNDANTYSGPTTINSGSPLWVGKTVGGTGRFGPGAVTNNGTLYANSAVLGTGETVNNGTLYLSPASLSAGRIVNAGAGTVYGTSVVQAASSVVNSGTWQCYSGSFGSSVLTNANGGTLNLYTNVLTYGQFVNGGTLSLWKTMTLPDPITFLGGSVYVNDMSNTLTVAGPITLAGSASFSGTTTSVTEVSGTLSGPGGIIRSGDGWCYLTSDANSYSGPTTIYGGKSLWVGKPGVLTTGRLGTGAITNNGTLYLDHAGDYIITKGCNGTGNTYTRYGANITLSGGVSTNSIWRIGLGSLTLTNGALLSVPGELTVGDRANVNYPSAPTNMLAVVNVTDGCTLTPASITFGNDGTTLGGTITGILNQVGGLVRTTANTAEDNGIRLGHYPAARSFYNMMGGTLIVDKDWDLGCATDGNGWFNMTGGSVYAKRVMLNERDNTGGYGRLTVAGGVMSLGSLTGSTLAASNGITADLTAPYLVEFGGAGGVIRAVTNITCSLNATLYGTNASAITFDSTNFVIALTGNLTGSGGLSKAGLGDLTMSGTNTYSGATAVMGGTLRLGLANEITNTAVTVSGGARLDMGGFSQRLRGVGGSGVVSNGTLTVNGSVTPGVNGIGALTLAVGSAALGGTMTVDVATDGTCDVLNVQGDLSLNGLTLQVADLGQLGKAQRYTIITYTGALSGVFSATNVVKPWYVLYDRVGHTVQIRADSGTLLRLL